MAKKSDRKMFNGVGKQRDAKQSWDTYNEFQGTKKRRKRKRE